MWTSIDSYQCSVCTARRLVTCGVMEQVGCAPPLSIPKRGGIEPLFAFTPVHRRGSNAGLRGDGEVPN